MSGRNLLFIFFAIALDNFVSSQKNEHLDILQPYSLKHGSVLNHRQIRECQHIKYGNLTYQLYPANEMQRNKGEFIETKYFTINLGSKLVKGHYSLIRNPVLTLSVLEPRKKNGCKENIRETVVESAKQKNCKVAMNGGFFNTTNGRCLGNIVSDGRKVQDSKGIQNVQFGIMKNGSIFTGYLSEEEFAAEENNFYQLLSGVVWLLRNNDTYIDESERAECPDTQETGSFKQFIKVISARTSIGHDKEGRIILLHIEGKTGIEGVDLWELAIIMKHFGAINAINTDGGGSATYVVNNQVVNYPSDYCGDTDFNCARPVSTILCAHELECSKDCGPRADCYLGKCKCRNPWSGNDCSILPCHLYNCSGRGICTDSGCKCNSGWTGDHCEKPCPANWWGENCSRKCKCANNAQCNTVNGNCDCLPGYNGAMCDKVCPFGWFGLNCSEKCSCSEICDCNHVNGSCSARPESKNDCLLKLVNKDGNNVRDNSDHNRILIVIAVTMTVLACLTILALIKILCSKCKDRRKPPSVSYRKPFANYDSSDDEDE